MRKTKRGSPLATSVFVASSEEVKHYVSVQVYESRLDLVNAELFRLMSSRLKNKFNPIPEPVK